MAPSARGGAALLRVARSFAADASSSIAARHTSRRCGAATASSLISSVTVDAASLKFSSKSCAPSCSASAFDRLGSALGVGVGGRPVAAALLARRHYATAGAAAGAVSRGNKGGDDIGPVTLDFTKLVKAGESPLAAYERLSEQGTLRWYGGEGGGEGRGWTCGVGE